MAWIFSDAMDSHGVTANLDQMYDSVSSSGIAYLSTGGRFGGGGIQVTDDNFSFAKTFTPRVDIFVSFAVKIDLFAGGTTVMKFTHTGNTISVFADSAGNWILGFGLGSEIASFPISAGVFHWVSMHLRVHATLGKWTVTVDGIQEVDFSGDTINTGTPDTITGVSFGAGNGAVYIWDDIIITDGIGGGPFDDLLTDRRIETIRPDGVGTATNFAPFPADAVNWNKVDEAVPDDDTTYVEDAVSAQRDTYTHTNMTLTPASIDALVVKTLAKNPDGGSNDIKHVIDSNGTVSVGSAIGLTSGYTVKQTVYETDPDTAIAWIKAGVDAVEGGFEVA